MKIVIYNTNSFGGNYEYSKSLATNYLKNPEVESCIIIGPQNTNGDKQTFFKNILLTDISSYKNKLLKKIYFVYRSILNPLKFYAYVKNQPRSVVIFNDFDQLTSVIWAPVFRRLKGKHIFSVILHDANRDMYLPFVSWSVYTMKKIMDIMDVAFYHELLPNKPYYDNKVVTVKVPHGVYEHSTFDKTLLNEILEKKGDQKLISIIGNIRDEKNYEMIIEALAGVKGVKLLIAGNAAHSDVPIDAYKALISKLGLQDRVIWIQKFMSDDELQSAIISSDVVMLYYKEGFTSQSGILNLIATHKKKIIVSDVASALRETAKQFHLGKIIPLDKQQLTIAIRDLALNEDNNNDSWDRYIEYASWGNHVEVALNELKQFK